MCQIGRFILYQLLTGSRWDLGYPQAFALPILVSWLIVDRIVSGTNSLN